MSISILSICLSCWSSVQLHGRGRNERRRSAILAFRHFARYNRVRLHSSIRVTPAMMAGVDARLWSLEELVKQPSR